MLTFKSTKPLTISTNPEVIPTKNGSMMVKATMTRPKFTKGPNGWEESGEEVFQFVAYKDEANQLLMYAAGQSVNVEGKVQRNTYKNKFNKEVTSTNFVLTSIEVGDDN